MAMKVRKEETLHQRSTRLEKRVERIESEQKFRIWKGDPKELPRLKKRLLKIKRRIKSGKET